MRTRHSRIALAATLGLAAVTATACFGEKRSVAAFCNTIEKHQTRYTQQMDQAMASNSLDGLLSAGSAMGELKYLWSDLAKVAPKEIQADVEIVDESWHAQEQQALSGDWLSSISTGFSSSNAMMRVNNYATANCGDAYRMF
ncbi:hypothetical protein [Corynebacterium sputi]|uniref:hypothetical protein n=1 Tax=Corynebacterium sputi TaxID=489915 RepID=UPI00047B8A61|nr:hypothetical protein [Corynebacterium sputi]